MNRKERWSDEAIDRALADLYRAPVPESFGPGWRAAIRREENERMNMKKKSGFWKAALPIAAALALVVGTLATGDWGALAPQANTSAARTTEKVSVARSAGPSNSLVTQESTSYAMDKGVSAMDFAGGGTGDIAAATANSDTRKLVRTASLRLATAEFERVSAAVRELAESLGGYVESMDEYSGSGGARVIEYALRVPSDKLDSFLTGAEGLARVTSRSESATDMSTQYADTALRLQTQRDKLERLRELMKQATEVSDLLEIENAMADAQYQIDAYESALRSIDRRVEDSQVSVRLTEETPADAAQAEELTLGDRLANGLSASLKAVGLFLQNLAVFAVMCLPALIPLAAAAVIVWLIVRARRKHKQPTQDQEEKNHDEN